MESYRCRRRASCPRCRARGAARQALIDSDGEITIGRIARFIDAATACDEHTTYAMLQRNDGESLVDVLTRLDQAVKQAIDEETTIDEINPL